MTPYAQVITGTVLAVGGPLGVLAAWWAVTRCPATQPEPVGYVPTGFRYCPAELRVTAAVVRTDGTAWCDGCGTHIPAGDA